MRRALSFLGTGNYQETTYVFGDKECRSRLFPQAVYRFFEPDELLVFLTDAAENKYLVELNERLSGANWRSVHIPDGKNETEIWEIFEVITKSVEEEDKLIFDITHAFRSIPLLAMISIVYLRSAKSVELDSVVYGALEAREGDRTPVFDLTSFMTLLDWTTATEMFIRTGQGREIAELLENVHQVAYREIGKDKREPPRKLKNLAKDIKRISSALLLARPSEVREYATRMKEWSDEAYRREVQEWAKPFSVLIDKINNSFMSFASDGDDIDEWLAERLWTEWMMIDWLLDKNQMVQAVLLLREWIVTYVIYKVGESNRADEREFRKEIEDQLNERKYSPQVDEDILKCWDKLKDLRNDTAHCGMRKGAMSSESIAKNTRKLFENLHKFALSVKRQHKMSA